jgi:trehalose 6-phosphate phosphatase
VAGVPRLLAELARRYAVVAVVSGRPVAFLAARLPASAQLAGLYGLEVQRHGERQIDPEAERWRTAATRLRAAALSGVLVEPEGLSATCHYRTNPSIEPQVMALAQEVAAATGLVVRSGRKSATLLPRPARTRVRSSGNGPSPFALPVISVMTSAIWPPSAPSTSWPPGDQHRTDRGAQ